MEDVFNIRYNSKMDRLELKKERKSKKIHEFIFRHKFMSVISGCFLLFLVIDFYLVYSFMKILGNI